MKLLLMKRKALKFLYFVGAGGAGSTTKMPRQRTIVKI